MGICLHWVRQCRNIHKTTMPIIKSLCPLKKRQENKTKTLEKVSESHTTYKQSYHDNDFYVPCYFRFLRFEVRL